MGRLQGGLPSKLDRVDSYVSYVRMDIRYENVGNAHHEARNTILTHSPVALRTAGNLLPLVDGLAP